MLTGILETLQVPLAQVRERLGISGMDPVTAENFRDKAQMKAVLGAAGIPCARNRRVESADDARASQPGKLSCSICSVSAVCRGSNLDC